MFGFESSLKHLIFWFFCDRTVVAERRSAYCPSLDHVVQASDNCLPVFAQMVKEKCIPSN